MERFRLCLLGPFQALLAGQPITGFESNKSRALLAYLATENGRPHPREFLAELLWPERPQGAALANLRHTLADLRTAIADHDAAQPCLLVTHQTIQFDPTCLASGAAFVDAADFCTLLTAGAATSLAACEEAVALYGGQFLQGFALDGSPEFEAWLVIQRERCDRLGVQALARLIHHAADHGDYAQGARWAQRLLELDPWNEDVHRQLFWLLAAGGERAAALRQYDICVRMLAAEFGVEPQPATVLLAGRIRAGEGDLGALPSPGGSCDNNHDNSQHNGSVDRRGGQRLAGAGEAGAAHNLPLAATPLIGRTRELAESVQTLAAPGCRLLTILGPGGSGKTRLAVEIARRTAPHFRDGAWFVDLTPAAEAAVLPTVLLKQLDAPESGPAGARERLLAYLAPKRMLLVLDNFEHLLEGADLVAEMLAAAPAVQILATSRARLNLSEEWLHPLEGMELPPVPDNAPLVLHGKLAARRTQVDHSAGAPASYAVDLPVDLEAYDASRLFLACVRRLKPGFAPQPDEAQIIAAICHRLEGMPLALELSASWIRSLPLPALAAEVENGLQRLETSLRNVPPRHRSMAAVFDQSWRLLTAHEQAILRRLSVFRGGATPEAAGAVTDAQPADLSRLVDASWLHLGRDGRYTIHELIRQYCAARLAEIPPNEAEEARRRHCTWFGDFLNVQARRMNYYKETVPVLMAEFGNMQAAWQWGVEHGQMAMACDVALSLFSIGDVLGWYHFAIQSYAPIMATLEAIIAAPTTTAAERSGARRVLGWLEFAKGQQSRDLGLIEQAKTAFLHCRAIGEQMEGNGHAEFLILSGWQFAVTAYITGAIDEARRGLERFAGELEQTSVDFAWYGSEVGRKFWLADCYGALARCDWSQARYGQAEATWQRDIAMREEMGEQRGCALNLAEYGRACITLGKIADAVDFARRSIALSQAFGDHIGVAFGRLTLGMAMAAQRQWVEAAAYLQQSLTMGRQSGNRSLYVGSAVHLGRVRLTRGEITDAQALFEEALDAATRNGGVPYVQLALVLNSLGMVARVREEWELAAQYHQRVLQQASGYPACEVEDAWFGLAQVYLAQGEQSKARALFERTAHSPATSAATRTAAEHLLEMGTNLRPEFLGGGDRLGESQVGLQLNGDF